MKRRTGLPETCGSVVVSGGGIALGGYLFDFSDVLKRYFVKQYGHITEYYAIDKTALRSMLYGRIEVIVEVP